MSVIVHLMSDPWAADAAHVIEAESAAEWRAAIAAIPPARFSAAVVIPGIDPARPYPVQQFNGANWPREVVSSDGFLVIRTGIAGAKLAEAQWLCLSAFPDHLREAMAFHTTVGDMTRRAMFPPPRVVPEDHEH